MKHFLIQTKSLVLLILLSFSATATTLPDYYPKVISMSGTIDRIDIKRGEIVVNDMPWRLSMNAKVHSLITEFSSIQTLRRGMKVGFEMSSINGKIQVAEIWILPDDYTSNHGPTE